MVHGVTKNADLDPALLAREVRPFGMRMRQEMMRYGGLVLAAIAGGAAITPFVGYGSASDFLILFALIAYLFARKSSKYHLRRPMDPKQLDPEIKRRKYKNEASYKRAAQGDGILLIGNDIETGNAVWINNDDARTHMLVFGSTGSGKTRFLLSLFYQALLIGSGVMYVDGKGDTTVFGLVFSIVRRLGREDDLMVINYLTGSKSPDQKNDGSRLSNTTNPFAYGPAELLRSLIVSLMSDSGKGEDMWKGRASALLLAVLHVLCYLRDSGQLNLDVGKIREYLPLDRVLELTQRDDIPEYALNQLQKYLYDLPGYTDEDAASGQLSPKCYEQHGYLTMQLTNVMSDLSSTYGHIFNAPLGEIDYKDLVYNRRILFVMLPALEKDPDALSGLGKLVVAGVRSALAPALGEKVEGSHEEVMDAKPTKSNEPFLLILDEYGYYSVKGFSVVAAQARSLGVAVVFAGQDLPSFKKGGEDEAKSVVANTNVKIFMKLEDSGDTLQLAVERGGESETVVTAGHEMKGGLMSNYSDNLQTRIEKRKRINVRDLVNQKPGQGHVLFGDMLVRCSLFFAEPLDPPEYRINRMLMVDKPGKNVVTKLHQTLNRFENMFKAEEPEAINLGNLTLDSGLKAMFNGYSLCRSRDQDQQMSAQLAFGMMEYKERLVDDDFIKMLQKNRSKDKNEVSDVVPVGKFAGSDLNRKAEKILSSIMAKAPEEKPVARSDEGDELDEEGLDAVMAFMEEPFAPDESIRQEAESITSSLSELISKNVEQQLDAHSQVVSPAQRRMSMPEEQLYRIEMEAHGDDERAREEAQRAMQLFDSTIKYPFEPQPEKMDRKLISMTLDELMSSVKKKTMD